MLSWFCQGSGMSIDIASGSERPVRTSSSSALSNTAESLAPAMHTGQIFFKSGPYFLLSNMLSRACIQLTFPRRVLISPLWAR